MSASPERGRSGFATTRWSLIRSTSDEDPEVARSALEDLLGRYWYPLYAYLRRSGRSAEDAADLVQSLFLRLLERQDIQKLSATGGRFRSWLLTALRHQAANARAAASAGKRGGGTGPLSLDVDAAERRLGGRAASSDAEALLLRDWARETIEAALTRLESEMKTERQKALFEALEDRLRFRPDAESYDAIATRLRVSVATLKVAVHRLRQRLRRSLQEIVAETLDSEDDLEDEMKALLEALR